MIFSAQGFLSLWGWQPQFASLPAESAAHALRPARVIGAAKGMCRVQVDAHQSVWAVVTGRLRRSAGDRFALPIVGDWVWVELAPGADLARIYSIVPRNNVIYRGHSDPSIKIQPLAANVDYGFIVTAIDGDVNYRRIDRYLSLILNAGAVPVIVLTKADVLPEQVPVAVEALKREFPTVAVYAVSKFDFAAADFFQRHLTLGKTAIFLGSSGVGKSTLFNLLVGADQMPTQPVRPFDGKGRHTTTARHLFRTIYGGLIIDTPGLRSVALVDHEAGHEQQFQDIEALIVGCKFSNCQHDAEPGCAIKFAIDQQQLSPSRWESFQKLQVELRHELRKSDRGRAAADKEQWKKASRRSRQTRRQQRAILDKAFGGKQ